MMPDVLDRLRGAWSQHASTSPLPASTSPAPLSTSASSASSRSSSTAPKPRDSHSSEGTPHLTQQRSFPFLQSPSLNPRVLQAAQRHSGGGSSSDSDGSAADTPKQAETQRDSRTSPQQRRSVLDHPLLQTVRRGQPAQDSDRAHSPEDAPPSRSASPWPAALSPVAELSSPPAQTAASSSSSLPSASSSFAPLELPASPTISSSSASSAAVETDAALSPVLPSFHSTPPTHSAAPTFLNTLLLSDRSCLTLCLLNAAVYAACFLLLLLHARLTGRSDSRPAESAGLWHAVHLWVCLSAMLVLFVVFSAPGPKQRISGIVLCLLLVCVATYASFASCALPVLVDVFGHALHPLRYAEWACTTPLMLLLVCNLDVLPTRLLLWILAADVLMIVSGLLASLSASYTGMALWLALSFACQLDTLWQMHLVFDRYRPRVSHYTRLLRTVNFLEGWLGLTYAWFPAVWLLAASGLVDDGGAMWLYFVGDTLGKMLYSAALLIINLELLEHEEALQRVQYEADMRVFLINERMRSKDDTARQAMDSNERKREFLRYLLHELRVPLNAIVLGLQAHRLSTDGLLSATPSRQSSQQLSYPALPSLPSLSSSPLLSVSASSPSELEGVDDMLQAAGDMTRLLDDVLSLQRIEDGELLLERRPMSMQDTAQACVRVMSSWAHSKGLRLGCDIDFSLQCVLSDEHRIRQLLINFLSNAIRFSSALAGCERAAARHPSQPAALPGRSTTIEPVLRDQLGRARSS